MLRKVFSETTKPTVTFYGATQTVTGSMHLVEVGDRKILLDCGLYLGSDPDARRHNKQFPFSPSEIDAVVISHAHIDHCGNLPNLVRQGFSGSIYATPATCDLMEVMLLDSAKIQRDEAAALVPPPSWSQSLYSEQDTARTIGQFVPLPYNEEANICDGVQLKLVDAGHILGSAMIALNLGPEGSDRTVSFTGDMGRRGLPFLHPPAPIPAADLVICESTYGGKRHDPLDSLARRLSDVILQTFERGGKVLIPAFSLGRAQIVVHYLEQWMLDSKIPSVPIYVDSPLIADIVEVYHRYPDYLNEDSEIALNADGAVRKKIDVRYLRTWQESRSVTDSREPAIIVASGGMLDAGRALYHLQQYVDDPRCAIVLVSYQAPQSLGSRLLQRSPTVSFLGKTWNKWAEVVHFNGFSGHADHDDIISALRPLVGFTRKVMLVHGELEPAQAIAQSLREIGFGKVGIPEFGQSVTVG